MIDAARAVLRLARMKLVPQRLRAPADSEGEARAGDARDEAIYRLKVGMMSLGAMVLMVGIANVIIDRARETDQTAVPQAAPTTAPTEPAQNGALENAGVVPDLPVEATGEPVPEGPVLPEQGDALPEE